jgi:hypothetical protein
VSRLSGRIKEGRRDDGPALFLGISAFALAGVLAAEFDVILGAG